jgi:hypothetical protein
MLTSALEVIFPVSTPDQPRRWPADDFVSTEELVARQGATPLTSVDELRHADTFGSEQEYREFLADLYASRRAGVA